MPDRDDPEFVPLRAWRCPEGFLVRRPPAEPVPSWVNVQRASGRPLAEPPADYWLVGPDGRVKSRHECRAWSYEDEFGVTAFVVEDGALREIGILQRGRFGETVEERVVVGAVQEVAPDDAVAVRTIRDAFGRDAAERKARRIAEERARKERVEAIPGALEEYDVGDEFRRTHELLLGRVAAPYLDETAGALLRTLTVFGALHRSAGERWRPTLAWVMAPFVTACRIAGDWRDIEAQNRGWESAAEDAPTGGTPERLPELRTLAESLRTLHADITQQAGWYEDTDARNSAAQLWRAAKAIDVARARLERVIGAGG